MTGLRVIPAGCVRTCGRVWISLSMVDEALSAPGTEVSVLWGEPDGGSSKPVVELHVQTTVRAAVGPRPFSDAARTSDRPHVLKLQRIGPQGHSWKIARVLRVSRRRYKMS